MAEVMDKNWMNSTVSQQEYIDGVRKFIEYAKSNTDVVDRGLMRCPCKNCGNVKWYTTNVVEFHCNQVGMMPGYKTWHKHGEKTLRMSSQRHDAVQDEYENLISDAFGYAEQAEVDSNINNMTPSAKEFYDLVADGEESLFPGCMNFSKLSFIIRLFHIKCQYGISNSGCTKLLSLFKEALPKPNSLPESFYLAKRIIRKLGLDYNKIDVCPKHCMFYMNEHANDSVCHICKESRWNLDPH